MCKMIYKLLIDQIFRNDECSEDKTKATKKIRRGKKHNNDKKKKKKKEI